MLLVDHINADLSSTTSLKDVLTTWVESFRLPKSGTGTLELQVRAYGGWWLNDMVSAEREAAFDYYQEACPSLIATRTSTARVRFEFADYLLIDQDKLAKVDHTVGVRTKAERLRKKIGAKNCRVEGCGSASLLAWAKTLKACPAGQCRHNFSDHFERLEQKQVDVHLSVDLFCAAASRVAPEIGVLSGDIDITPAILAAGLSADSSMQISVIRVARSNPGMDHQIRRVGINILEMDGL